MYNLLTLLKHWELILTYRHCCCTKCGNICRLTDRIAEETNRNAGLEISHLNLCLYSWIPEVYEILREGSKAAEAKAAETLRDVKAAMKINYFEDESLIK